MTAEERERLERWVANAVPVEEMERMTVARLRCLAEATGTCVGSITRKASIVSAIDSQVRCHRAALAEGEVA